MNQSPSWEANGFSASQKIPHILWNMKVHCCVCKSLPLVCVLSHINPVYSFMSYFLKICFNIFLSSMLGSSKWLPSFIFPHQNSLFLFSHIHTAYLTHLILLDHPNNFWWWVKIMKLLIMQFSPVFCYFSLLGRNIFLCTLIWNNRSLLPLIWGTKIHTHMKQQAKF